MKKILRFIYCIFSSPKKEIKMLVCELRSLSFSFSNLSSAGDKVDELVKLFQVLAPVVDSGKIFNLTNSLKRKNYGQLDYLLKDLEVICFNLKKCSRRTGINDSAPGELVTAKNIYLGGKFGLPRKSIIYWLIHKQKLQYEYHDLLRKKGSCYPINSWDILVDQAEDFVSECVPETLAKIDLILGGHED